MKKDIKELLQEKQLALLDFGSVELVKPTGRFIDADDYETGYIIEIQKNLFGAKSWVAINRLRIIHKLEKKC